MLPLRGTCLQGVRHQLSPHVSTHSPSQPRTRPHPLLSIGPNFPVFRHVLNIHNTIVRIIFYFPLNVNVPIIRLLSYINVVFCNRFKIRVNVA